MDIDLDALIEEHNKLAGELSRYSPGSEEYDNRLRAIERHEKLVNEYQKLDDERMHQNREYDLQEQKYELDCAVAKQQAKDARRDRWNRIGGVLLGIGGGLLGIILSGDLSDYTILDRNKFNIASRLFPKM